MWQWLIHSTFVKHHTGHKIRTKESCKIHKIKKLRNHLIIQIGEIYNLEDKEYKVITATSKIVGEQADTLVMTESVYWLKDVETEEIRYVPESVLKNELPKYNEIINHLI